MQGEVWENIRAISGRERHGSPLVSLCSAISRHLAEHRISLLKPRQETAENVVSTHLSRTNGSITEEAYYNSLARCRAA
jgi:hypothetical protein